MNIDIVRLANTTAMFNNKTRTLNVTVRRNIIGAGASDTVNLYITPIIDNTPLESASESIGTATGWTNVNFWQLSWTNKNYTKAQIDNMTINYTATVSIVGKAHTVQLLLTVIDVNMTFTTSTSSTSTTTTSTTTTVIPNFNISLNPAYNSYFKSDSFNITLTPNIQSYHFSGLFNISFQLLPIYIFGETTTTTTIIPGAGGGGVTCPINSHKIEDNICVCDFGYAKDLSDNCIASIFSILPGANKTAIPFSTKAIFSIVTIAVLFIIVFINKERKDKVIKKAKDIKEHPEEEINKLTDKLEEFE